MKRMAAGETCDLVIMAGAQVDQLIAQGKVAVGSRVDLVRSGRGPISYLASLPRVLRVIAIGLLAASAPLLY